jgi:transcriptional regulator with XRE-family HTH domain
MLPESFIFGSQRFFPKDTDVVVARWCAEQGRTLDDLAPKLGLSRMALSLILRGIDPVTPALERKLREIMQIAQQRSA